MTLATPLGGQRFPFLLRVSLLFGVLLFSTSIGVLVFKEHLQRFYTSNVYKILYGEYKYKLSSM
jgi:hypothetical protein